MNTFVSALKNWMRSATASDKRELARRSNISVVYLSHLASDMSRPEHRQPNPTTAIAIEHATRALNRESKGRLPVVWRTDLNTHCRNCDLAKRCLGDERIVASHFPVVLPADSEGGETD